MKLTDIISLAKQGYKPADIKELIALAEDDSVSTQPEIPVEDNTVTQQPAEPDTTIKDQDVTNENDNSPTLDEMQKEIEKLRGELKVAQQNNVRAEVNAKPTNVDDAIDNMFREYM